jgi:hypothetical protein
MFAVKALITELEFHGEKCLICGATGIAAVQYPGGTTLHSLFRLGIGEEFARRFRSSVRRDTPQARHILAADLMILDEVSVLTPWVANRVSLTLQSISVQAKIEFGGKRILFVGDLLQLPPVAQNLSIHVVHRLITRLSCWPSIRKFELHRLIRAPDPGWAAFSLSIAKGQSDHI